MPKPPPPHEPRKKLLIALQYSPHDEEQAHGLIKLICDLEPKKCEEADLLLSTRFDLTVKPEIVAYAQQKFTVWTHRSRRKAVGWPAGCNYLFADTYSIFKEKVGTGHWHYDFAFFCEADDLPTRRGWIEELRNEAYSSGKMVIGPWMMQDDWGCQHINGNCMIHKDFWRYCREVVNPPLKPGWDVVVAPEAFKRGHPSRLIYSDYRLGTDQNPLRGEESIWGPKRYRSPSNPLYGIDLYPGCVHGIKGFEGQRLVRNKFLG